MNIKELNVSSSGKIELDTNDLPKSCVVIISNGQVKFSELPPFAETKIITTEGKVQRVKWDIGTKF